MVFVLFHGHPGSDWAYSLCRRRLSREPKERPSVFIPRPLVRSHAGITRLAFLRWQMDALAFCLHGVNLCGGGAFVTCSDSGSGIDGCSYPAPTTKLMESPPSRLVRHWSLPMRAVSSSYTSTWAEDEERVLVPLVSVSSLTSGHTPCSAAVGLCAASMCLHVPAATDPVAL